MKKFLLAWFLAFCFLLSSNAQESPSEEETQVSPGARLFQAAMRDLWKICKSSSVDADLYLPWWSLHACPSFDRNQLSTPQQRMIHAAVGKLEEAARDFNETRAMRQLADLEMFGLLNVPRNWPRAFRWYQRLAEDHGEPRSLFMLGFFHATGLLAHHYNESESGKEGGKIVLAKRDQQLALVYYSFAAQQGDIFAQMALGYRHLSGIAVQSGCDKALLYYGQAADQVRDELHRAMYGWDPQPPPKVRLVDEEGGLFGPAASGPGEGDPNAQARPAYSQEDVLQFYQFNADRGDPGAQLILGQMYYHGTSPAVPRNLDRAFRYFRAAANQLMATGASSTPTFMSDTEVTPTMAQAAAMLGQMFWRGNPVARDNKTALRYFLKASEHGNPVGYNCMGLMYLHGIVVPANKEKAIKFFEKAAELDYADAYFQLGLLALHKGRPDFMGAMKYFNLAARNGHTLGLYHLGSMHENGQGVAPSCPIALTLYKRVAERADHDRPFLSEAYDLIYRYDDYVGASLLYLLAGEIGYEIGQSNQAWLLDLKKFSFISDVPSGNTSRSYIKYEEEGVDEENEYQALVHWNRAANQGNVDARVRVGDLYYYGIGTRIDYKRSVQFYQAAETENSAIAMFNLGYMHEHGIGVKQDFHLAKRYYDRSGTVNPEAYLPVLLAMIHLRFKYFIHWIQHGGAFWLDEAPQVVIDSELAAKGGPPTEATLTEEQKLLNDKTLQKVLDSESTDRLSNGDSDTLGNNDNNWPTSDYPDQYQEYDDVDMIAEDKENMLIMVLLLALGLLVWARQQPAVANQRPPPARPAAPPARQPVRPPPQEMPAIPTEQQNENVPSEQPPNFGGSSQETPKDKLPDDSAPATSLADSSATTSSVQQQQMDKPPST